MRRDRIANEKVMDLFPSAVVTGDAGAVNGDIFDTMRVSTSQNRRENLTNIMVIISIASGWAAAGILSATLEHCNDGLGASMVAYATLAIMQGQENEDLYLAEIKDFSRYIRIALTAVTANVRPTVIGVGERSRREPVVLVGREKAVTYDSSPITL